MNLNLNLKAYDYQSTPAQQDVKSMLGGLLTADWRQSLIARGYGWHFDVGAFQTGITGGGNGTSFDQDQPEFAVSIPSSYTLIPLRVEINALPGLQTTDSHLSDALLAVDVAAAAVGLNSTNGTMETPTNMRSSITSGCPATVCSALTMNITNPTLGVELARATKLTDVQGIATTVNLNELKLVYEPLNSPFFVGPCCMYGYWGGNIAVVGYASVDFLVIPSALITALV